MKITVKLFATLSKYSKGGIAGIPFSIELEDGKTLRDLVECLEIPEEETKVVFVDGIAQPLSYELLDGDDVGIFPPIGGG